MEALKAIPCSPPLPNPPRLAASGGLVFFLPVPAVGEKAEGYLKLRKRIRERRREEGMAATWTSVGLVAVAVLVVGIAMPASAAGQPPAPAPSSDGEKPRNPLPPAPLFPLWSAFHFLACLAGVWALRALCCPAFSVPPFLSTLPCQGRFRPLCKD